jgi:anti-sigma B factor antagonist
MLRIKTRRIEPDITVVELTGRMTMGPDSKGVEEAVLELLRQNEKKIIFDMSGVPYVDSSGMGSIAYCFAKVMRVEGGFRIAGLDPAVKRAFAITRLDSVLPFYPSVPAASADFTLGPSPGAHNPW